MNKDDSLLTSRTAWAGVISIAGTQLDTFKALPATLQVGCIAVACAYILARGLQKGLESFAKKPV